MSFAEIEENNPHLRCVCGHPAGDHLYTADHLCVVCSCKGFELDATLENVVIAVTGRSEAPG
jgi:hypothetical protein